MAIMEEWVVVLHLAGNAVDLAAMMAVAAGLVIVEAEVTVVAVEVAAAAVIDDKLVQMPNMPNPSKREKQLVL